jgi:predicted pyridoxine 5'-phosphate oxidase superfamily flavin-nucleotide-binding protein
MRHRFFDVAFTPAVQAEQARRGSRAGYAALSARRSDGATADVLEEQEFAFIAERDSFYLATVSETGWPYVQHRGGPVGFVRRVDESTIGWADYTGNRQYVSMGNAAADDRVAMIFVDYPHQERLKILGHMRAYDEAERPDLARLLAIEQHKARVERFVLVTIEAFDWNCPQHITPRFTVKEIEKLVAPLYARIAELEMQLSEKAAPSAERESRNPGTSPA